MKTNRLCANLIVLSLIAQNVVRPFRESLALYGEISNTVPQP